MAVRYDKLKVGDVIYWHGAKERIVAIRETPAPANENYPNEKGIYFDLEPVDDDSVKVLGKYYSHGTYGGVGCLTATVIDEKGER